MSRYIFSWQFSDHLKRQLATSGQCRWRRRSRVGVRSAHCTEMEALNRLTDQGAPQQRGESSDFQKGWLRVTDHGILRESPQVQQETCTVTEADSLREKRKVQEGKKGWPLGWDSCSRLWSVSLLRSTGGGDGKFTHCWS